MAKAKKYKLIPLKDRLVTTPTALASLAVLGGGLSLAFNPVALGVAGGVVAYTQLASTLLAVPAFRNWVIKGQVKKGNWQPVPEDALASRITAQISKQLGRKEPPKIYTVDDKTVVKIALPFGMRWLFKIDAIRDQAMPGIFAALTGANTIITTKEALNNGLSEKELRFIAAHEMMHLHAKDNRSPSLRMEGVIKKATRVLFWAGLAGLGAAAVGASLPIMAAGGIGGALTGIGILFGSYLGARVINNFGMRTVENRADRNALYITRDLESGKSALASIDPTAEKKPNFLMERMMNHPSYGIRAGIMTKAFNKVSKYPIPAPPAANRARRESRNAETPKAA